MAEPRADPALDDPDADIERKPARRPGSFLVGELDGSVVATAMAGHDLHRGWVDYPAVDPRNQQPGLGREPMVAVGQRLRPLGCAKVDPQVRDSNEAAAAFYAAIGHGRDPIRGHGDGLIADDDRPPVDHVPEPAHHLPMTYVDELERTDRVEEIRFLAEVAHMAASARTWQDLMGTVIDRSRAASHADVCSLYLVDRDGTGLTLAATNGLDQEAVGVARLVMGQGITGLAAQAKATVISPDVHTDARFAWIRGVDQARFTSMCSVPLIWEEQVVGVLNVQTAEPRRFTASDIGFLEALAGLLAGMVEKSRLHAEAEAQLEQIRAIDEARAKLVTVVTHALRTPLAVVRAYVELLGSAATQGGSEQAGDWEREALTMVERLDETVDSILDSLRVMPDAPVELRHVDLADAIGRVTTELRPMLRNREVRVEFRDRPLEAMASIETLGRLIGYLLENASKYAPERGTIDVYGWRDGDRACVAVTDDGPGIPEAWRERIFEPFVRLDDSPRGAGIGLFAARRLARSMEGELTVEPRQPYGSQFVLRLRYAGQGGTAAITG